MNAGRPRAPRTSPSPSAPFTTEVARLRGRLGVLPDLAANSRAREAVAHWFGHDARRLLDNIGQLPRTSDVDALHQARVGLRRLRTDLQTFRPLLDRDALAALAPELAWLGRSIGAVRDHDVFVSILAGYAQEAPDDREFVVLVESFDGARDALVARLAADLVTDRAIGALTSMTALAVSPPVVARADEAAIEVFTELARRPWRKLVREARALDATSPVEALHELRIRVKKARYAVEAAAAVSADAAPHARSLARLQTTLGDINDAAITIHRLRAAAADDLGGLAAYAAGRVAAHEQRRIKDRREQWPGRWDLARRKRVRAWLDSSE